MHVRPAGGGKCNANHMRRTFWARGASLFYLSSKKKKKAIQLSPGSANLNQCQNPTPPTKIVCFYWFSWMLIIQNNSGLALVVVSTSSFPRHVQTRDLRNWHFHFHKNTYEYITKTLFTCVSFIYLHCMPDNKAVNICNQPFWFCEALLVLPTDLHK